MPHETHEIHERKAALQELRNEYTRRLHKRELQMSRLGIHTDPAISNEIEDLQRQIADLDRQIAAVQPPRIRKPPPRISFVDPRFPVTIPEWQYHTRYLLNREFGNPVSYWCYVEPGIYLIGKWEPGDPFESVELGGFWVAKHPITVLQYQKFIEAGGYDEQDYWTPHGWQWRTDNSIAHPEYWEDTRFSRPDQPVVGVSWYEATAFAAWLNQQLASVLPDGSCVRLPTEAEWEAAAAYDAEMQRRTYPWGSTPEPSRILADFNARDKPGYPMPVRERPDGAAACGAQDMAGSVWEATTSSYRAYPTQSSTVIPDFEGYSDDVPYRGGSWWDDSSTLLRCGSRNWYNPYYRNVNWGVRIFLSPVHMS